MKTQFRKIAIPVVVFGAILVGCASSNKVERNEYSGFLKDYSKLQLATSQSGAPVMRYLSPNLSKGNYNKVWLEPAVLYLGKDQKPTKQVPKETMDQIVAYLGNAQKALLQRKLALADGPGPNTLHVRTAITAISLDKGLKPYEVIPVALVFAAASSAAGTRDEATAVYVEGEATDSLSGELMVEFVRKDSGPSLENENTVLTLKDVQPLLDKWTDEFYKALKNLTKIP